MTIETLADVKAVSRKEWLAARVRLLEMEKQLTRQGDAVSAARRALPRPADEDLSPYAFPKVR